MTSQTHTTQPGAAPQGQTQQQAGTQQGQTQQQGQQSQQPGAPRFTDWASI